VVSLISSRENLCKEPVDALQKCQNRNELFGLYFSPNNGWSLKGEKGVDGPLACSAMEADAYGS
jgi:hypothetical protein